MCEKENPTVINKKTSNLLLSISEVNSDIEVYYALKGKVFTYEKVNDELDSTLDLIEIASDMYEHFEIRQQNGLLAHSEKTFDQIFESVMGKKNQDIVLNTVVELGRAAIKSLLNGNVKAGKN